MKQQELLFVYNANSDIFSTVTDFAHKILSPSTYQCSLCALTYGNFAIKEDWKRYLQTLPHKCYFKHKDEFLKEYKIKTEFPAVLAIHDGQLREVINRNELEACKTLDGLKKLINQKIHQHFYNDSNINLAT